MSRLKKGVIESLNFSINYELMWTIYLFLAGHLSRIIPIPNVTITTER